jgi:uncharacterized protein (TIGR03437 family)
MHGREGIQEATAETQRERIRSAQTTLIQDLRSRGFNVTGSAQTLLNAVFVRSTPDRVAELQSLTGVVRVANLPPVKMHLNTAVELINATAAWTAKGGTNSAGAGVKIGIIDSGIDHTHPAFRDSSLSVPAGYPKCSGADCAYTNNKIIVARSYVSYAASGPPGDPYPVEWTRPDDLSPRDRIGHGTANAMIAAGVSNTSPDGITITGVAPKAYLGNYKIFGSPGVNDSTTGSAIIAALEDAYLDGMDIVSMSFGSPGLYGPLDKGAACGVSSDPSYICDVRADAVESAVANGMVVVVSAGNESDLGYKYPLYNAISSPGTAPSAITVGAMTNSHIFYNSVRLPGGDAPANLQRIDALLGDGAIPGSAVTGPLRDVAALSGQTNGLACSALPSGSLSGALALIVRGTCSFAVKVANAQAAGAVGVILYLSSAQDTLFSPSGLSAASIPAAMISYSDGSALKTFLSTHAEHTASIDPLLTETYATANDVSYFTSRGPSIGELGIKPELVAVGSDVFTATQTYDTNSDMWNPLGYNAFSGTSFSTPMVAGAAALVQQDRPALTPADVKSAVVNTAAAGVRDSETNTNADVQTVGAGKLDVNAAVSSTVSAEPAALSFGKIATAWPPAAKILKLRNFGTGAVAVSLSAPSPLTLSQTNVTLQPGADATQITVALSGSMPAAGAYEGFITITGAGVNLRVPYYYVRPSGTAYNVTALYGDGVLDIPGGFYDEGAPDQIAIKVTDQFGAPAPNIPVSWTVTTQDALIVSSDARTDVYGIAAANVYPGFAIGDHRFVATVAGMSVSFYITVIEEPMIYNRGVVNAASGREEQGQAPGSYISFYGDGLSTAAKVFSTSYLPLSLADVSVSFDADGVSVPGRIHYVSDGQVNVFLPWELNGKTSVQTKVSIGDISTAVYTLKLNTYSPALFRHGSIVASRWSSSDVSASNPVPRGQQVELYCNGLGPVDQPVPSGEPTPLSPLIHTTQTPEVTIGGVPAQVTFSGLTPNALGLYQINVVVPSSVPAGNQPVIVTIGGVSSEAVALPVS